jgi:aspartate carbamoyltransferase catalytic subunit
MPASERRSPTVDTTRHLLAVNDLDRDQIVELLDLTDTFVEVGRRSIPKVPALRGRTVVSDRRLGALSPAHWPKRTGAR